MSGHKLPPFDDDVKDLLDAERRVAPPSPATADRVFAAVAARLVVPSPFGSDGSHGCGGSGGAAGASGAVRRASSLASFARRAWPLLSAFALGAGVTAATVAGRPPVTVEKIVYVERPAPPLAPVAPPAPSTSPLPPPVPARTAAAAPPSGDRLAAERALLDVARGALAGGDAGGALAAIQRHGRDFPSGALTEEREALAVKALVMAGRYDEARARGARFRAQFPRSMMLRSVESSLATIP
jgi:hypothetical protein